MHRVLRMQNTIQPYAWGSHSALAELLGQPGPTTDPQAELWMGAHPKAPSQVWADNQWHSLEKLVSQDPVFFLGEATADRFKGTFPFLFKVLAVDQPLSIQAHPNAQQAQRGFEHENDRGIALHSSARNYRDNRHKPECVCALTPFWTLCGFRDPTDIVALLDPVWPKKQRAHLVALEKDKSENCLPVFLQYLFQQPQEARHELVLHIAHMASQKADSDPIYEWIVRLNEAYPGDIGCIGPGFLNLICLEPGQALFLPSGLLHAYLKGVAIEVMANSDNVLRGGLTVKHLDSKELIRILNFQGPPVKILSPVPINNTEAQYPSGAEEFVLSVINIEADRTHSATHRIQGPEMLLCIKGRIKLNCPDAAKSLALSKGQSILVTAGASAYTLTGKGVIYKASVAIHRDQSV